MTIVHIIESLDAGGAERVLLDIIRLRPSASVRHEILCLAGEGALAAEAKEAGIRVVALGKKAGFDALLLPRLCRELVRMKADVLHLHLFTGGLWGRLASWLTDIPCVLGVQNVDDWIGGWRLGAERLLAPLPECTVGVTRASLELRKPWGLREGRTALIPNGSSRIPNPRVRADIRKAWGYGPGDFVVGALGRGVAQKNPALFLQVAQAAKVDILKFVWMGEGPALEPLRGTKIFLAGHQKDPMSALSACDAVVSTSVREGFSLALLEALRSGLPVLATDIPGNRDLLEGLGQGHLVKPAGAAETMASTLAAWARDPGLARTLGERCRAHAMRFLAEDMAASYDRVYREALSFRNVA
ncbi:MAG: glycosyltransferase [Planctomycetota bacterium]